MASRAFLELENANKPAALVARVITITAANAASRRVCTEWNEIAISQPQLRLILSRTKNGAANF
jgi:hypothetical protein